MSAIRYHVKRIRVESDLSQADIAAKLGMSPSRLSRLENGEIEMTLDEAKEILTSIDSEAAKEFREYLDMNLPHIPFDHPDWRLLQETESVITEIKSAKQDPELKAVFLRRLDLYEEEIRQIADYVLDPRHTVAIIGSIGIGKTTAICHLTNLIHSSEADPKKKPVLEVGGGATTVCEVMIKAGPNYGLSVEPRPEEAIRKEVQDFADYLLATSGIQSDTKGNSEDISISREIERAIRNMSGLTIKRPKGTDGKRIAEDPALAMARRIADSRELEIEILTMMNMPRRDKRDIWCPDELISEPLKWLQLKFTDINNGRDPNFTLPKRIDVTLPHPVMRDIIMSSENNLSSSSLDLCYIDTKGIDHQTVERADLERHFYDQRTVTILCSGFNAAPEAAVQTLLKRALDARAPDLDKKTLLLVLPRPDEALAVKDESGNFPETDEEGYELKSEQVELLLNGLGLAGLPCVFFNSFKESPINLRKAIFELVSSLRASHKDRLASILSRVRDLIENKADAQRAEIMTQAARQIKTWSRDNRQLKTVRTQIEDSLLNAIGKAHASTLRATLRRRGDWHNLDYSHHLSYGARIVMDKKIEDSINSFNAVLKTLRNTDDYFLVDDFLEQMGDFMKSGVQRILTEVQVAGPAAFGDKLADANSDLWMPCLMEWGAGPGFRGRAKEINSKWFEHMQEVADFLQNFFQEKWEQLMDEFIELLDSTSEAQED